MHDLAIGRVFRRLRQRRDWRQADVAARARISDSLYSELERGQLNGVSLGRLRRVAAVLEVDLYLEPRWRGGTLERLVSGRHAAMTEAVTTVLIAAGWEVRPEVSFNVYGERGIVDLVAWHAATRTLLLVEIKTELTDLNGLLGVADRRRRLASQIAASCGWEPITISEWIVVAEGRTNRRRVAEHRTMLKAAYPADGRSVAGWLANPDAPMRALWFLPDSTQAGVRRVQAPRVRVRPSGANVSGPARCANFRGQRNLA
jgi:transcriptional regulator with XRE-family HTH domain